MTDQQQRKLFDFRAPANLYFRTSLRWLFRFLGVCGVLATLSFVAWVAVKDPALSNDDVILTFCMGLVGSAWLILLAAQEVSTKKEGSFRPKWTLVDTFCLVTFGILSAWEVFDLARGKLGSIGSIGVFIFFLGQLLFLWESKRPRKPSEVTTDGEAEG